jgi:predicted acylesterase/phospholipase RssA
VQAVVASSAYTIAYEAVPMQQRLWTDGGIVTNQPIRPAVRLGADVLFLVMLEPMLAEDKGPVETFVDVGMRALEILVSKNLLADLKMLDRVNHLCESVAKRMHLAPEQVQLEIGEQSFRYVKRFTVCPQKPLPLGALDFEPALTRAAIVEGYRDGANAAREFWQYRESLPLQQRRIVRLEPSHTEAARA